LITGSRDTTEENRAGYAYALLESSGYVEPWKTEIANSINEGSEMDIELIIQDLLMNQVDNWQNFRPNKDVLRRLDDRLKRE
jgi:hypothetical protein